MKKISHMIFLHLGTENKTDFKNTARLEIVYQYKYISILLRSLRAWTIQALKFTSCYSFW